MSEEEIIKYIKEEIEDEIDMFHWFDDMPNNTTRKQLEESIKAHQGLLDLYIKLKEKYNLVIKENLDDKYEEVLEKTFKKYIDKDYISKDKIREFIDEETKKGTYEFKSISAKRLRELLEDNK